MPRSEYARAADLRAYQEAQDRWVDYRRLADLLASPDAVAEARDTLATAPHVAPTEITPELIEAHLSDKARRRYTEFYRVLWREMIPKNNDRCLFPALFPPGPVHIHGVRSMALSSNRETALVFGFWAALPIDYLLRIVGTRHLDVSNAHTLPVPELDHPLAVPLLLRALRLNCLTNAYADLWAELYDPAWADEGWVVDWPGLAPLAGPVVPEWSRVTPLRTEAERRAALVEIDALVAVWLGLSASQLVAIYKARFPQLFGYEGEMWFDAQGRQITRNWNSRGEKQAKDTYEQLIEYLRNPERVPPPDGYEPPFYKADREAEYRQAHAVFSARLKDATP